jgi:DNA (cytosine-5)-methyltransferase 1
LFAGIGGFEMGLERSGGFETVAQCEIDPYCQKVLAKHWPQVKRYEDIRDLTAARLAADGITVDAICGGFPCQDVSVSNPAGRGLSGSKSGLWSEYARLISELRPRVVFVENVAALLARGMGTVLGDLAALGYDAEWEVISASDVGAPHERDRVWIVAYPAAHGWQGILCHWPRFRAEARKEWPATTLDTRSRVVAWIEATAESVSPFLGDADGVSGRLAQLELGALGNAVVPQIPELLGRAWLEATELET